MPKPKRQRQAQWERLELLFTSPEQHQYELIRPIVLCRTFPTPSVVCMRDSLMRHTLGGAAERHLKV